MRTLRSALVSVWVVLALLATAGFAAFSTRGSSGPADTTFGEPAAAPLAAPAVSARVGAFLLAESLVFRGELPERIDPPSPAVQLGPDALSVTPLTVGATTTSTTTTSTTTTTQAPTTTTTHVHAEPTTTTTTTHVHAESTTTTTHGHAEPTTTTTAPPDATTTTTEAAESTTTSAAPAPAGVEQWRGLVAAYFPADRVEEALRVMHCESKGDPNARNPYSGAAGLFQFMPRTWGWASAEAGFDGASVYDPEANVAGAAWLVEHSIATGHSRGAWGHWTCQP